MRAAFYRQQGPARLVLELGELEVVEPRHGEVRVRLRASGVNPSDVKARAGIGGRRMAFDRVVPHSDGAGEIESVGEGISRDRLGERVWIWNGQWSRAMGTAAEAIVLPSEQAVRLPDGTSYAEGACLGIPATTAFHAVKLCGAGQGMRVLVTGGAGAVGFYAIQFAKARGAQVIASVSNDDKGRIALEAGADAVVNYRDDDYADRVRDWSGGSGVDAVVELDLAVNGDGYAKTLRPHGTVAVYGLSGDRVDLDARGLLRASATLHFMFAYDLQADDRRDAIAAVTRAAESGQLKHRIFAEFTLDRIADAHELVEGERAVGNVVLRPDLEESKEHA